MRQSAQFARRLPTLPSQPVKPAQQMDFSRPVSRSGTVGFALLSLSLAAMTFVVTIWGFDLPIEFNVAKALEADAMAVVVRESVPVAEAEVVFEPKTTGRLPVFGGMTPIQ